MDANAAPQLPGLALRRPLGQGLDPPWLAKADDGSWVVLRRGPRPPELPDHPALLVVLGAVADSVGATWVVTGYTSGSGLDRRLDRIGRLAPALVLAWGAVLAEALAVVHESGLVHGDLRPARVLLGHRDTVLLDASCARAGTAAEEHADVAALIDLLTDAAGGPAQGPLVQARVAAQDGDLTARELAVLWQRAAGGRSSALSPRGHRRRAARAAVAACALTGLLAAAAVLGTRLAHPPDQTAVLAVAPAVPAEVSSSEPLVAPERSASGLVEEDWVEVLADLDERRGAAFGAADSAIIRAVDAPDSEAYQRDVALVQALSRGGVTAQGWTSEIVSAVPTALGDSRVELTVVDERGAYDLVDDAGEVVAHEPRRASATWFVALVKTTEGWRISSVAAGSQD